MLRYNESSAKYGTNDKNNDRRMIYKVAQRKDNKIRCQNGVLHI
jgi:hypothetical protein